MTVRWSDEDENVAGAEPSDAEPSDASLVKLALDLMLVATSVYHLLSVKGLPPLTPPPAKSSSSLQQH